MNEFLDILKKYRKESLLGPLFKMMEACFDLAVPLVVARIIDVGVAQRSVRSILSLGSVMVALGVVGLSCVLVAQYFAAKAAMGFGREVRSRLFAQILGFSYSQIDRAGTATLITRMSGDVNQLQSGLNLTLRLALRSPFIVFGALVMAWTIDSKVTGVFIGVIAGLFTVVFGVMRLTMPLYKQVQQRLDALLRTVRENLTGVRVIRAFSRQEEEKRQFDAENRALFDGQILAGRLSALTNPLTICIVNMGIVVLLYRGAWRVETGGITQGMLVALVNYLSQVLVELVKLSNLIIQMSRAGASWGRVLGVLRERGGSPHPGEKTRPGEETHPGDTHPGAEMRPGEDMRHRDDARPGEGVRPGEEVRPREDAWPGGEKPHLGGGEDAAGIVAATDDAAPFVEFDHVDFCYEGNRENSLSDICFRVGWGQTVGIIGATGSGKTTLVSLIPRFYEVSGGRVLVGGADARDLPLWKLRSMVGMVPQKAVLFGGSVRENMRWGKADATDEEIWEALGVAQAAGFVAEKHGGLDFVVAQEGKNLSGGQRQRLCIARALVRKPEILILDDSFSALDFATDAALRREIRRFQDDAANIRLTTFYISARVSSIRGADLILVLDDGKLAGAGTHDELLETCRVYGEICRVQLGGKP
ncbi:MAG: ABC transporter ATP-binding protein/permease [Lachnospiraceae bacterium]|jgi:ABC-type multidrug transport system fused ATPase/permease subunit|nr:ABC transporter ATP-binding protein/permease [Lachnospiraceae bacterium]